MASGNGSAASIPVAEVVAIVGATGTGKSAFALDLADLLSARGLSAEIVNADAMQLYRGMDIGTAKLAPHQRRDVAHHLLDVLEITEDNSVAGYQPLARNVIDEILARGNVPLLVGGSGLYVSSVIFDFRFPATNDAIRARLEGELLERGAGTLYQRLKNIDPDSASAIGSTNGRRLVRALEVVEITGQPVSGTLPERPVPWRSTTILTLETPRAELVARLDARVEEMWRQGLVHEAATLRDRGLTRGTTAGKGIGYAQAIGELEGELSQEEAIVETQSLTRRYARRQVGWFRRYPRALTLDASEADSVDRALAETLGLEHGD